MGSPRFLTSHLFGNLNNPLQLVGPQSIDRRSEQTTQEAYNLGHSSPILRKVQTGHNHLLDIHYAMEELLFRSHCLANPVTTA